MENNLKQLYFNYPSYYSPYSYEDTKRVARVDDDFLIIDSEYLSFNYIKSFHKVDYNKGYKTIFVCENIYNKIKDKLFLNYNIKKYYKAYKYGTGKDFIEIYKYNKPYGDYALFTSLFDYQENIDLQDFDGYNIWYKLSLSEIMEINSYQALLNKIEEIKITHKKPKLLLHSCCGPCSSYCLEFLHDYFDITILYFNPNIYPSSEYKHRLDVQKEIVNKLGYNIDIIEDYYNYDEYLNYIKGEENDLEKGKRCYLCYEMRLKRTCQVAFGKYDYFTTTISISPYKVASYLNEIGFRLEKEYHVKYLYSDFKLNDGYKESIRLSKLYGLYRQEYCGCEFSIPRKN